MLIKALKKINDAFLFDSECAASVQMDKKTEKLTLIIKLVNEPLATFYLDDENELYDTDKLIEDLKSHFNNPKKNLKV